MSLSSESVSGDQETIVNVSSYKFVTLRELPAMRADLRQRCHDLGIKGTILLSPEGINLFLAAPASAIAAFLEHVRSYPGLADLPVKESCSQDQPFSRMLVRIKKEIIAFGVPGIAPAEHTSRKISATQLKQWLDEGRDLTLLDVRNDYEVQIGTFRNAKAIGVDHFRHFPAAVERLPDAEKKRAIVMFCTGGIRCEKAGPFMEQQGFGEVYQLDGGILKYFEEVGGEYWDGECFVFDKRVALDPHLTETATTQCYACQHPLTPSDQQSPDYVPNVSCPFCVAVSDQRQKKSMQARQAKLQQFATQLPGSQPYNNIRPLNVRQQFVGLSLLDFVDQMHPHMGREFWRQTIDQRRILLGHQPAAADLIVREGMSFRHVIPDTVEPPVNCDIRLLHQDDWIVVVEKPAPLPTHPSGRFNRHTLIWMLQQVYSPQRLKAVHRLDSNTSGVVVVARHKKAAAAISPLFESGQIQKTYLAQVHGHPAEEHFSSTVPIAALLGDHGLRGVDPQHGQPAQTRFQVLERYPDGTTLLQVTPVTGRTNQIRIHLWDLGFPICGDLGYLPEGNLGHSGSIPLGAPPMRLHAWKLAFEHPATAVKLEFETALPQWHRQGATQG